MSRSILIDTDPGIDDAMAIFYALQSTELAVLGLTTVFGNASIEKCTANALHLLEIAGRSDIPVAKGARQPLTRPFAGGAPHVHGSDGQGNLHLPPPTGTAIEASAAVFIVEQVMNASQPITLVTLGPLTNIALALLLEPHLPTRVQEIVMMGGNAFSPGNISPAAEANIFGDPEAADLVLGADCPITMCGLDVTERVYMSGEVLDRVGKIDNARARHLTRILPYYRAFSMFCTGKDGIHVHDSTTITYLLAPDLFSFAEYPIRVDCTSGISRGKTWPAIGNSDQEESWQGRRPIRIGVEINAEQAIDLELGRLAQATRQIG